MAKKPQHKSTLVCLFIFPHLLLYGDYSTNKPATPIHVHLIVMGAYLIFLFYKSKTIRSTINVFHQRLNSHNNKALLNDTLIGTYKASSIYERSIIIKLILKLEEVYILRTTLELVSIACQSRDRGIRGENGKY
jgi:uncharacterized membrane protein